MESVIRDLSYSLRRFRRQFGSSLAIVLTLALGIGANTAIFSTFNNVVLRKLPFAESQNLVVLRQRQSIKGNDLLFSVQEIGDYRASLTNFEDLIEYHAMSFTIEGEQEALRVAAGVVSSNFFSVLGVRPILGRDFTVADDSSTAQPAILLSYDFWQRQFGKDPHVTDLFLDMNDRQHRIIGVLPQFLEYPNKNDIYILPSACPIRSSEAVVNNRDVRMVSMLGRIRAGIPLERANAELRAITHQFQVVHPGSYPDTDGFTASASSLHEELVQNARPILLILVAATTLLLLISCTNVTSLILAQHGQRQKELTVRLALGASNSRIIRLLLTESILFAVIGGILGIGLAHLALKWLIAFSSGFTTRSLEISIDATALLYTLAVSAIVGIGVGLIPAIQRRNLVGALRESSDKSTAPKGKQRIKQVLVVAQVAITFILLLGASLMIRSIVSMQKVELGFTADEIVAAEMDVNWSSFNTDELRGSLIRALRQKLDESGAISSWSLVESYPFDTTSETSTSDKVTDLLTDEQDSLAALHKPKAVLRRIDENYFNILNVSLKHGRAFSFTDDEQSTRVAIINRHMALTYFGRSDVVGRRVSVDGGKNWLTVIGVVGNEKRYSLTENIKPQLYVPVLQYPPFHLGILVKSFSHGATLEREIRSLVHSVNSTQAVIRVVPLQRIIEETTASPRLTSLLLTIFSVVALAVTVTGIAGVIGYSASLRTREIGIRMAIGTPRRYIFWLILQQGVWMTVVGLLIGYVGAFIAGNIMAAHLFGVQRFDIVALILVSVVVAAATLISCWIPARHASTINPRVALGSL